ncbi:MAG: outer membrane beta-barrel protein [Gammaproteobacteria bacterium]
MAYPSCRLPLVAALLCLAAAVRADPFESLRPYFQFGVDGAHYTNPDAVREIELENPSQYPFPHFAFGVDIGRYWGAELAVDYVETNVNARDLTAPGSSDRIGEYATWNVLAQGRWRYPLLNDRLVPYVVAGLGIGIGEFNDRSRAFHDFPFSGADTSFIGALGGGIEYFIASNLALGIELKHVFGFETDVSLNGQGTSLDLEQTLISAGGRLFFDKAGPGDPGGPAADSDRRRGYVVIRTGGTYFTDADAVPELEIGKSVVLLDFGAVIGMNLSRQWGMELAAELYETTLEAPGFGRVTEYSLWNVQGLVRWRYPLRNDRVVPYLVAGAGWGWTNVNGPNYPRSVFPIDTTNDNGFVASFGAGVDYFIAQNASVGLEARYIEPFDARARIGDQSFELDNSALVFAVGLRLYFP